MRAGWVGLVAFFVLACGLERTAEDYAEWEYLHCLARVEEECSSNTEEGCAEAVPDFIATYESVLPALHKTGCGDAYWRLLWGMTESPCTYYEALPDYDEYRFCVLDFAAHCRANRDDDTCIEVCEYELSSLDWLDLIPCD